MKPEPNRPVNSYKYSKHKIRLIIAGVILSLPAMFFFIPLPVPLFPEDYSTTVLSEKGEIIRVFLNRKEQWRMPDHFSVPEKLEISVLTFEDKYFYYHPGINPLAVLKALARNIRQGEKISGASTITMQVCRLMAPKERTYGNKIKEMLQSLKIEFLYSKEEILKLYLAHAPYGGNIVGYAAASYRYFGKPPGKLTWSESALLAVLPNAPGLMSPTRNRDILKKKRDGLLKELKKQGHISANIYRLSLKEPLPDRNLQFRFLAPHACRYLKNRTSSALIHSTLSLPLQETLEDMIKNRSIQLKNMGIQNMAAVIMETSTGKVKAYAGSQDFFAFLENGQVDGVQSLRSTGSILKPFLYAASIDEGIILPRTLIKDIPTFYNGYSPKNSDNKYRGLIRAEKALVRSLNVPAVRLLYTYGQTKFYRFLKSAGMEGLDRPPDHYGLSLILGGGEISLWQAAALYAALGNNGSYQPPLLYEKQSREAPKRVLSPGACWHTLETLKNVKRPGLDYFWEDFASKDYLAWKTGTSYGNRDAWAIGVSPQWTIAVWSGNFTGKENPVISGAMTSAPLLFSLFEACPGPKTWFEKPAREMKELSICKATGFTASPLCQEKKLVSVPKDAPPLKICPYHKKMVLSEDGRYQVCSRCWEKTGKKTEIHLVYPPEVAQHLRSMGHNPYTPPPRNPQCPVFSAKNKFKIIYPNEGSIFYIPADFGGKKQKIRFKGSHQNPQAALYWYMDDKFIKKTSPPHEFAYAPDPGPHVLTAIDEEGEKQTLRFKILPKN